MLIAFIIAISDISSPHSFCSLSALPKSSQTPANKTTQTIMNSLMIALSLFVFMIMTASTARKLSRRLTMDRPTIYETNPEFLEDARLNTQFPSKTDAHKQALLPQTQVNHSTSTPKPSGSPRSVQRRIDVFRADTYEHDDGCDFCTGLCCMDLLGALFCCSS